MKIQPSKVGNKKIIFFNIVQMAIDIFFNFGTLKRMPKGNSLKLKLFKIKFSKMLIYG